MTRDWLRWVGLVVLVLATLAMGVANAWGASHESFPGEDLVVRGLSVVFFVSGVLLAMRRRWGFLLAATAWLVSVAELGVAYTVDPTIRLHGTQLLVMILLCALFAAFGGLSLWLGRTFVRPA